MIEYLSGYLPYDLQVKVNGKADQMLMVGISQLGNANVHCLQNKFSSVGEGYPFESIKPFLRPFSHLMKEIKVPCPECERIRVDFDECDICAGSGTTSMLAIIALAKMVWKNNNPDYEIRLLKDDPDSTSVWLVDAEGNHLVTVTINKIFGVYTTSKKTYTLLMPEIYQFLLQHHFDIFNLIPQKKAMVYE